MNHSAAGFLTFTLLLIGGDSSDVCWRESYSLASHGRGIDTCPRGLEKSGLLCYPKCRPGFYGVGPVCWSYCPDGWRDDGALCNNYGGWTVGSDNSRCPWYDVCGLFNNCSNCNNYPGTQNHGCTCHKPMVVHAKETYGRGVGKFLQCADNEVQDGLFCYPKCSNRNGKEFIRVGSVCWEKCKGDTPHESGAVCCVDGNTCAEWTAIAVGEGVGMVAGIVGAIAAAPFTGGASIAAVVGVAAGVVGGLSAGAAMGAGMAKPICDLDQFVFYGAGKCQGRPMATRQDLLQSECNQACLNTNGCQYANHNKETERCELHASCALTEDEAYETFTYDGANGRRRLMDSQQL